MRSTVRRLIPITALVAIDVAVLAALWPAPEQLSRLGHPHRWVAAVGADAAARQLAQTGLFLAAAWLALGLAGALAAQGPGATGRAGAVLARRLLPVVMHRIVAGSLGAGLVLGVAPLALGAGPAVAVSAPMTPGVDWPTDGHDAGSIDVPWPSTPPPAAPTVGLTPRPANTDRVLVRAGDSLWLIAARRLGPAATDAEIAAAWPRWYRDNTTVIGSNPAALQPGQVLAVPESNGSAS